MILDMQCYVNTVISQHYKACVQNATVFNNSLFKVVQSN